MEDKRVLIVAPQHSSKMYAWPEYSKRLRELTYENVDFYFSDNSETKDNSDFINKQGFKCEHLESKSTNIFTRIAESHNKCREYFLKGDYDYMLHLETDIIPPIDVIELLLQKDKMVVGAMYDVHEGEDRMLMIQPLPNTEHRNIKAWRSVNWLNEMESVEVDGTTKRVFSCGLGCVLIRRDIVQMVQFRNEENILASADTFWANDLYANGVPMYVATDIYCIHNNMPWTSIELKIKK